ncbi:MGMT family protein [Candidatus Thioglobus sp.]|uniref:MGMT family protein n=1 Tax=Candidatus Thioglobus sp. TaxID=2026721 RepID=UPI002632612B|nr:MGMT family protein [Candidatus Thioglobus sp.]MDG2394744.1 MGMT family protein [Candidatus Thioglobus sp.]
MTSFQHKCFETLVQCVPRGSVISYARLADLIGHSNAYRAVGTAMNKNVNAPD